MAIVIDLAAASVLLWLAARGAPLWIFVLIIAAVCLPWLVGWLVEHDEPETQPGLLVVGGVLSFGLLVSAAIAGRVLRHWLDRRQPYNN